MRIDQRSYGGKVFRPKPVIHQEENLIVVSTCWGSGDGSQNMIDEIVKYVTAFSGDVEATSPFERLNCLSDEANCLRVACLLANELVYRAENKNEYTSGYEVLILYKKNNQLTWAHVGGPHVLLKRDSRVLLPLITSYDFSMEMSDKKNKFAPLPRPLLGMESSCQITCGDLSLFRGDQIVLASSSHLPSAFWLESQGHSLSLDKVTRWLAKEDSESPFWLATVSDI